MEMARVGCTNNMVNKNGNGHERYGKGGMHKQACTQEMHNLVPRAAQISLFLLLNLLFLFLLRLSLERKLINKNGNGHANNGKDGMHTYKTTSQEWMDGCTNKLQAIGKEGNPKQAEH